MINDNSISINDDTLYFLAPRRYKHFITDFIAFPSIMRQTA